VVATVMSNFGLHRALAEAGIAVQVTPVGDRNVSQAMRQGGFALGGEQSGHILFAGAGNLTGDGLFTALQLCSLPSVKQRGFAQAFARFQRLPQRLCNVKVRHKPELASVPAIARQTEITVAQLGDAGRLLLRYSGTEPLCRVMIEGPDAQQVERLCRDLAAVIEAELG
jgi:phosphoglucosamine mutase